MAVELEHFLIDQLARLPEDHPDRPFITGLQQTVAAYAERGGMEAPAPEVVQPSAEAPTTDSEQQEQERITLRGRLGRPPRFSDTPRGVRRAEFNLAVHEDDDATSWHTILAFRERAERLETANPQKGQYAEVIGYRKLEQRKDRDGNPKTVERIIAAHIRLR